MPTLFTPFTMSTLGYSVSYVGRTRVWQMRLCSLML